ncbi:hypothetical protein Syun_001824 [Stephania yunnanensis]|uniref:non-specific serine/threonine protein kinase n=1 Tax=Stephania yunnanensis TaxID=152371 RepID=A0AAP0LKA3_9MAGN
MSREKFGNINRSLSQTWIDANVQREIINHRSLRHPNIVKFKGVILTPTHLAIVMEYASGGELFERICKAGRFSEDEVIDQVLYFLFFIFFRYLYIYFYVALVFVLLHARFFFQQLISGVSYCHTMVCKKFLCFH